MKNILLLFLMTVTFITKAQTYHPFPTNYGSWNYQFYDDLNNPTGFFTSYILYGDTTISGTNYKKISGGALRESSKIIYFYPDTASQEYILYNFNLNQGDTIFHPFGTNVVNPDTVIVSYVDSVLTSFGYSRQLYLNSFATWIEGVGSLTHLLDPTLSYYLSADFVLQCMVGDSGIFFPTWGNNCITSVSEDVFSKKIFSISPNPWHTSASIEVTSSFENSELKIYNTVGEQVRQQKIVSLSTIINRDGLRDGIYYFLAINDKGNVTAGKFVIE